MQSFLSSLHLSPPLLALLPSVVAHGFLKKVVIDGTTYHGSLPQYVFGSNSSASPNRQIYDIGPVMGASNPDLNCGLSAPMVVPADPGSATEFYWGSSTGTDVSRVSHLALTSFAHSSGVLVIHTL